MRVLITGSNGFIGSWLGRCLKAQEGITVFGVDTASYSPLNSPTCHYYNKQDILDYKGLELIFDHVRPHVVYHLAAKLGVKDVTEKPGETVSENVLSTLHVTNLCKHYKSHLIFASTSEVYGLSDQFPYKETNPCVVGTSIEPRWSYAISKLAGEHLTLSIGGTVVRFFNVTGPGQKVNYVLPIMVDKALRGEDIPVYGDGSQTRCFADVRDVVRAVGGLVDKQKETKGQIYNIGHDEEVSMFDLAWKVRALVNSDVAIDSKPFPKHHTEMPRRVPDLRKIRKLLTVDVEDEETGEVVGQEKWECKIGLKQTIEDMARGLKAKG